MEVRHQCSALLERSGRLKTISLFKASLHLNDFFLSLFVPIVGAFFGDIAAEIKKAGHSDFEADDFVRRHASVIEPLTRISRLTRAVRDNRAQRCMRSIWAGLEDRISGFTAVKGRACCRGALHGACL